MAAIDIGLELKLKPGEDRRLNAGHQWVFSNELEHVDTSIPAGTLCRVFSAPGKVVGTGFFNPHSLIAVRMLTRGDEVLDAGFVESRVYAALRYRKRIGLDRYARVVYSEGDFLPGLMADCYGDLAAVEILTAGMELLKPQVIDAINKIIQPKGILFRNDNAYRKLEGLSAEIEKIGEVPPEAIAAEGKLKYMFSSEGGQKTGFFYDQRD
ncbi:MAG: RlmI/RlmK family 23S rRNA methyltransferase, partial [Candidatus Paceibacterota bacterium]